MKKTSNLFLAALLCAASIAIAGCSTGFNVGATASIGGSTITGDVSHATNGATTISGSDTKGTNVTGGAVTFGQ